MAMITSNEFKNGMTINYNGKLYKIEYFMHVKPGKGSAFVRTKLRDLRVGTVLEYTFRAGEPVDQVIVEKKEMQYLYSDGSNYVFMNTETYEQVEIPAEHLEEESKFMVESMLVNVLFLGEEVLGVELPDKVTLEVVECVPGVKGDTKTNATKDATLSTGAIIKVPLFIEQNEKVIVNTQTGEYVSREK